MMKFNVQVLRDGEKTRKLIRLKVNHALRTLWRQRNIIEAFLWYSGDKKNSAMPIFGKFVQKRAINICYAQTREDRPFIKHLEDFQRLPSKFNKLQ